MNINELKNKLEKIVYLAMKRKKTILTSIALTLALANVGYTASGMNDLDEKEFIKIIDVGIVTEEGNTVDFGDSLAEMKGLDLLTSTTLTMIDEIDEIINSEISNEEKVEIIKELMIKKDEEPIISNALIPDEEVMTVKDGSIVGRTDIVDDINISSSDENTISDSETNEKVEYVIIDGLEPDEEIKVVDTDVNFPCYDDEEELITRNSISK